MITLSWSAGSEQDVYQLQRKREDESSWSVVLDWGAGTGDGAARSHVDTAVNQTYGYSYRIKAKSIAGMLSASWGEVDVDAPS